MVVTVNFQENRQNVIQLGSQQIEKKEIQKVQKSEKGEEKQKEEEKTLAQQLR